MHGHQLLVERLWDKRREILPKKHQEQVQNKEVWDTTEARERFERKVLVPQDLDWKTDTRQAVNVIKRTELTSSSTGTWMVNLGNLETVVSQRTVFPEFRDGAGPWEQITNSRSFRCYQAGKKAGGDDCCERHPQKNQTSEGRGEEAHLSQQYRVGKGLLFAKSPKRIWS